MRQRSQNQYAITQTVPPTAEPLTLAEAKAQCRVEHDLDDEQFIACIAAARGDVEAYTGRQLMPATWELQLDRFPRGREAILLPHAPALAVDSVEYIDLLGATQTFHESNYIVDVRSEPGRIVPVETAFYPSTALVPGAVTVTYTAGYGDVPQGIKYAMRLLVESKYTGDPKKYEHAITMLEQHVTGDWFHKFGLCSY
jgi:uncharacterized phiE125 gp8 family phage protein